MKISEAIVKLTEIQTKYGDLPFVGGYLTDDSGLDNILVTDFEGHEIFPKDQGDQQNIEGVFLT